MTLVKDILAHLDAIAPIDTKEQWDNCGLLIGDADKEVKKVLLCLDITPEVVEEAKEQGSQLIISHHPVIFAPLSEIGSDHIVYKLIENGVFAICMHTNLDKAENIGVNACLARALSLSDTALYPDDFLCVGTLNSTMTDTEFASFVKDSLSCRGVRYTKGNVVKKVAVSSGGGGDAVFLQEKYGFDALVTGELKHHQFLHAKSRSLCALEAGHFNTEDVVISPLLSNLEAKFSDVKFVKSKALNDVVNFV